jgi:hypothetical protein
MLAGVDRRAARLTPSLGRPVAANHGEGAAVRRWWRRRRVEQRARLADNVRRLAGFADAAVTTARRLGAEGARWRHRLPAGLVAFGRPAR